MLTDLNDGSIICDAFSFRVTALEPTRSGHIESHAPRGAVLPYDACF
jgi:hypothetical protein